MCSQVHQLSIHIPRKHSPCTPQTISNSISLRYCAPISYSNSRAFTDRSAIPDGINQSINSLRRRRLVAPRIRPRGAIAAVGRSGYPPPHVACAPWYVLAGRHAHGRPRASAPSASAARRAWKSSPHQVVGGGGEVGAAHTSFEEAALDPALPAADAADLAPPRGKLGLGPPTPWSA